MRKTFWIILAVIALAISPPGSLADTFTSLLDTGNSAISGFTGPFGIVSVDLTSGSMATITFTAQSGFLFGATGAVDVNINATSWTISDLTGMALWQRGANGASAPNFARIVKESSNNDALMSLETELLAS